MRKQKGPYDWGWEDTLICAGILLAGVLMALGAFLEAGGGEWLESLR